MIYKKKKNESPMYFVIEIPKKMDGARTVLDLPAVRERQDKPISDARRYHLSLTHVGSTHVAEVAQLTDRALTGGLHACWFFRPPIHGFSSLAVRYSCRSCPPGPHGGLGLGGYVHDG